MKAIARSPWTAVILAIVAMTIGYTFYLKQSGALASANGYFCPAEKLCQQSDCNGENDCKKHECSGCPFCNKET